MDVVTIQKEVDGKLKTGYFLKMENLMLGRENANIIDLKMGTSTVTYSIKENPNRM